MIGFLTNNDVYIHDLTLHSLPFLLQYSLGNPQILDYADLKVFTVADEDMQTDFDFMRCYRLLRLFLGCFSAPSKSLKQSVEGIKTMLDSITDKKTQPLAIADLFSCLFIQKNDKFVCHQYIAQMVVNLLEGYHSSPYIKEVQVRFQARKAGKKVAANLDSYFVKKPG
jgi:hypothetical protein